MRVSSSASRRRICARLAIYVCAYSGEATPTIVLLALCGCGLRLRGATIAIKERCLLYQCSSHISIHTHEIQCLYTYRERATKHARMQSALRTQKKVGVVLVTSMRTSGGNPLTNFLPCVYRCALCCGDNVEVGTVIRACALVKPIRTH